MAECPSCNTEFQRLGAHWNYNPSHRVDFTDYQHEILTGLLMGDGTIYKKGSGHKANFRVSLIVPEYLEWLDEELGVLSTGVELKATAKESCQSCKLSDNQDESDYSDVYRLRTRNHFELQKYHTWYKTGKKVFPKDIGLTSTVLTHWYISDGNLTNGMVRIGMSNEIDNREKIEEMFSRVGLPVSRWDITEREDGSKRCCACFNKETSEKMFDYMDDAPAGFGYKFPQDPMDE